MKPNLHGRITCGTSIRQERADRDEVRGYLASHPGACVRDVAMECHLGNNHAERLVGEVMKDEPENQHL
jgi:hypothetical protein